MKNPAYARARTLIDANLIKDFRELAVEIQKSTLMADLHMAWETLTSKVEDPGRWTIHELATLADLLEIDHSVLLAMADKQRKKQKKRG